MATTRTATDSVGSRTVLNSSPALIESLIQNGIVKKQHLSEERSFTNLAKCVSLFCISDCALSTLLESISQFTLAEQALWKSEEEYVISSVFIEFMRRTLTAIGTRISEDIFNCARTLPNPATVLDESRTGLALVRRQMSYCEDYESLSQTVSRKRPRTELEISCAKLRESIQELGRSRDEVSRLCEFRRRQSSEIARITQGL